MRMREGLMRMVEKLFKIIKNESDSTFQLKPIQEMQGALTITKNLAAESQRRPVNYNLCVQGIPPLTPLSRLWSTDRVLLTGALRENC